jgi:hypothetical protein
MIRMLTCLGPGSRNVIAALVSLIVSHLVTVQGHGRVPALRPEVAGGEPDDVGVYRDLDEGVAWAVVWPAGADVEHVCRGLMPGAPLAYETEDYPAASAVSCTACRLYEADEPRVGSAKGSTWLSRSRCRTPRRGIRRRRSRSCRQCGRSNGPRDQTRRAGWARRPQTPRPAGRGSFPKCQ